MSVTLARKGFLLCLIGPAGGGKTSHGARLLERYAGTLKLSISATTRPPRAGEQDGVHYHFITREDFEARVARGEFFEWEEVHGNLYGTLYSVVREALDSGTDLLLDVDIRGSQSFKNAFPREAVSVFLVPPSAEVLRARVQSRSEVPAAELARRLETAKQEYAALFASLETVNAIDYFLVNDQLDQTFQQLVAVFEAERARLSRISIGELRRVCLIPEV